MATLTRKQRELKDREAQILKLARPILLREGYQGLSMERLASEMEYAKGTLYNHFPNKEDIVLALAVESLELRFQMMESASTSSSCPRVRLVNIGAASELFASAKEHFAIEAWIRNSTIWDKASPERQQLIQQCEGRCMGIVAGLARDAVARRDLVLPQGLSAEELIFGFWSITYGSQVLSASSPSLAVLGITNPVSTIRHHCYTLLNGFAWQPIMDFQAHEQLMSAESNRLRAQFADYLANSVTH
ncbi:MAG: TetR/AcrR family transcriptional regulator [Pirellulaceae bacterium]|nr:TetR/AcrR family transcriptional regulator [Pirellulaceae bacterium]